MTGEIDPTDPVKESPVGIIIFVLTMVTEPIEKEEVPKRKFYTSPRIYKSNNKVDYKKSLDAWLKFNG